MVIVFLIVNGNVVKYGIIVFECGLCNYIYIKNFFDY